MNVNVFYIIINIFLIKFAINEKNINIGFLFPKYSTTLMKQTAFNLSGGAVKLAVEAIEDNQLLYGYNISCYVAFDECIGSQASGKSLELVSLNNVSVVFGPTCIEASLRAAYMTKYYDIPSFIWGMASTSALIDDEEFRNVFSINYIFPTISYATIGVLKQFNWTTFSFIYASNEFDRCKYLHKDFETALNSDTFNGRIVFTYESLDPYGTYDFKYFLNRIKNVSRIIVGCFDKDGWKRKFMLDMYDQGLNNNEYVLIIMDLKTLGVYTNEESHNGERFKIYENYSIVKDGRDNDAYQIAKRTLFVDLPHSNSSIPEYTTKILDNIKEWPWYCENCFNSSFTRPAAYAPYLYDAIILWASILNKTLSIYGGNAIGNASLYKKHCAGEYVGMTGVIKYTDRCLRMPTFYLYGFDKTGNEKIYLDFVFNSYDNFTPSDPTMEEMLIIFENWGSKIPLNVPECGYSKNQCPVDIMEEYKILVIIVGIVIILIVISLILVIINIIYKVRVQKEMELNRSMIHYIQLMKPEFDDSNNSLDNSIQSFSSGNLSKLSLTKKSLKNANIFFYLNEAVLVEKHNTHPVITKTIKQELNYIKSFDSEKINKYYGFCLDGPEVMSVWKYCKRGNLFEFLQGDSRMYDTFFCMSLIKDLTEGIEYLHKSPINYHGFLTSKNCQISDHFQLILSNFDFKSLRKQLRTHEEDKLWIAPEILNDNNIIGSKEGDIYSLGIIISEIITKKFPWDINNREESVEEIVYLIKRGGSNRPKYEIKVYEEIEIDNIIIALIYDCLSEAINNRPEINKIIQIHEALMKKQSKNLMDHVFEMLEAYSETLKEEVVDRTRDLVDEQKKIDILLRKMLPAQVAQCLKLGKVVEPENFENVTVMFSDIVKFTDLSAKCSAFQVINLVNDLYTQFDNAIEGLDVYKVETIGDGYLCVSGLPQRNGNLHGHQIALLGLNFLKTCNEFKITHLPNERITVRVGCNTGPCVAGVVGLAMPRYCLFGDTVNTASRMESNGKAGRIHLTESCFYLLETLGGFIMEPRGEVIIKGKGVMNTYWLNGMVGGYNIKHN
uniref:Guanylate cyclase n=1 Tax=Parastrongyloides trichosuri TaxID=131310 RepID=A0A0N5A2B0_PARTI